MARQRHEQHRQSEDTQGVLAEAIEQAAAELAQMQRERADALRQVIGDPTGAAKKVREIDHRIEEGEAHLNTLREALEHAAEEARTAEKQARTAASAADRAAVARLAAERVELARSIDAALADVTQLIARYTDNGKACAAYAQHALEALHSGDTTRLHDNLSITLNRANGVGQDVAVAVAHQVLRISKAFNAPSFGQWVRVNDFLPVGPATLAQAAEMDARTLAVRFGGSDK